MMQNNLDFFSKIIPVSMSDDWYELVNVEHFWIEWRFEVAKKYFYYFSDKVEPLLEIGCGNGIFRDQLENSGFIIDGCDLNFKALSMANSGFGRLMLYNIFDKKPELLNKYPVIFIMDVIEHIENEYDFLNAAISHLKNGGYLVINVPASMFLFSNYDREAGHLRRYNKKKIKKLFLEIGIDPVEIRYWGFSMIPLAIARKLLLSVTKKEIIKKGFEPPNKLFHFLLKTLKIVENIMPISPPLGTSILAIGQFKRPKDPKKFAF
jgi:2-polyprenyl-3-methyl-5-hydroxy-6-metoxy-1,4-benzoquinol methylase